MGDIPAEERRLQADMVVGDVSIEALLVQPHVQVGRLEHLIGQCSGTHMFAATYMAGSQQKAPPSIEPAPPHMEDAVHLLSLSTSAGKEPDTGSATGR
jgi:hypothetical protein